VKKQSRESIGYSFVDLVEKPLCQISQRSDVTIARKQMRTFGIPA
jgi:hypothetical protein